MDPLDQTPRTTLKRIRERGSYDRAAANAILDEGLIGHVGFCMDGEPIVIPMAYARDGDSVISIEKEFATPEPAPGVPDSLAVAPEIDRKVYEWKLTEPERKAVLKTKAANGSVSSAWSFTS